MGLYARKDVMFVRGAGMLLFDDEGNEYLDFVSGLGAVNLGHAHPNVASAVAVQASTLVHVSNLYHVEHRAELAQRLVELSGLDATVFFCNSGTEASEARDQARSPVGDVEARGDMHQDRHGTGQLPRADHGGAGGDRPARASRRRSPRCCQDSLTCRSTTSRRSDRGGRRRHVRGDARAGPGRGRRPSLRRGVPPSRARAVRRARRPAHPR